MSRARAALGCLVVAACDLRAAAEDYQRRYCAQTCDTSSALCAEGCHDGTRERWTFHVVHFEKVTGAPGAPVQAFLEERSAGTGEVVARDDLRARGVSWPSSPSHEALLARSEEGLGLSLIGYQEDAGGAVEVTSTTVRRVGYVTRSGTDWSTVVADAWLGSSAYSAATTNGASFWLAGEANSGAGGVRLVTLGSTGATVALDGGAASRFVLVRDGHLFTSGTGLLGGALFDWGPAASPNGTPAQLPGVAGSQPVGFELLDLRPDLAGLDTLYVALSAGAAGLAKYIQTDGGWVKAWEASAAAALGEATTCSGLATRIHDGAVTILCARGARGDAVVRFDDSSELDGGPPAASVVVRANVDDLFRGVGILAE